MNRDRQRVQHLLYEGEVEAWTEDIAEFGRPVQLILRDGPNDLGNDLGDYLVWLLGPGRAEPATSRCKMAKRLRIIVEDLEPDETVPERRAAEGHPMNTELAELIKSSAKALEHATGEELARMRDDWQAIYRNSIRRLRSAFMLTDAYELLAAQAARKERAAES